MERTSTSKLPSEQEEVCVKFPQNLTALRFWGNHSDFNMPGTGLVCVWWCSTTGTGTGLDVKLL